MIGHRSGPRNASSHGALAEAFHQLLVAALAGTVGLASALVASAQQSTYTYDAAGRLERVTYANGAGVQYVYDEAGNLLQTISTGAPCTLACSATVAAIAGAGSTVTFTGSATPSACVGQPAYLWSFGDGSPAASVQSPSHTFAATGSYNWQVTATIADQSCTASGTITIVPSGGPVRRHLRSGRASGSAAGAALASGESARLAVPVASPAAGSYADFGISLASESAEPVTLQIDLRDAQGTLVWTGTCSLAPFERLEIPSIRRALGTPALDGGHATVRVLTAGGRVHTETLPIDGASGNPVHILPDATVP